MTDTQNQSEQDFFCSLEKLTDNFTGESPLSSNPDMALLFSVRIYLNKADAHLRASEIDLEYEIPPVIIANELLQIAKNLAFHNESGDTPHA